MTDSDRVANGLRMARAHALGIVVLPWSLLKASEQEQWRAKAQDEAKRP